MQVVSCKNCGGEHIPMGGISVDVTFMEHNFCKECHQSHTEKQTYFFCSVDCFQKYTKSNLLDWENR